MDVAFLKRQLVNDAERIGVLVTGVALDEARWRPDSESWSILEVVNHLYDEEREDFRVRLDIILHDPDRPWPPIDPQGWVAARRYNERKLEESLANFLAERRASLQWLDALEGPDWDAAYQAPWGVVRAGDMFAAWVTHDQLHMRQLVELHRALTERHAEPYELGYAGDW
jgi:hypothetical protein